MAARLDAMQNTQDRVLELLAELSDRRRERAVATHAQGPAVHAANQPLPIGQPSPVPAPLDAPALIAVPQVAAPHPTLAYHAVDTPVFPVPITPAAPANVDVAALQTQLAAISAQLAAAQTHRTIPTEDPFDRVLLKQLTEMKDFNGQGNQPWLEYQQAFESKASLISSLPKSTWVRMLHSHVVGPALQHARSVGLVVEGVLQPVTFEEYCARMNSAMFGEVLTLQGNFQRLLSVTQEGPLADPLLFLKEKEKYLNKIPITDLSHVLRAGAVLIGMDAELRLAVQAHVRADPTVLQMGQEFQFQSYESLKGAVLAVVSLQSEILNSKKRGTPDARGFQQQKSPRPHGTYNPPAQPATKHYTGAKPGGHKTTGRWDNSIPLDQRICADCGGRGHFNSRWHGCPKHVKEAGARPQPAKPPPPPPHA